MATQKSNRAQGRWKEIGRIGKPSGQGVLRLVQDSSGRLQGDYVRKVLENIKSEKARNRFNQEIEVSNALAKTGLAVVKIVDHDVAATPPWMVTPYYPAGDLDAKIRSGHFKGNLARVLEFLEKLIGILSQVHQSAVHRDLKPANILIDKNGNPVLGDFGLCWLRDTGAKRRNSGTFEQIGSRHYIAPEALGGIDSVKNPRGLDVYSIGKIAYALAAGHVLPGLELPREKFDLSISHPKSEAWFLFNELVGGLVNHNVDLRMDAWLRLPHLLSQVRELLITPKPLADSARFQIQVKRALATHPQLGEAERQRIFNERRDGFRES